MIKNLPQVLLKNVLLRNKITLALVLAILLILSGGVAAYFKFFYKEVPEIIQEVPLTFNPEGVYAILTPRKDGVAIDLSARRISQYNAISYNLPYFDKGGIQRAAGDLETWIEIKKGQSEFKQENLLGSCSQGFTSGKAHCVFDENVENGTLVVRFKEPKNKENIAKVYKYTTLWHLQAPDVALGKITSNDERFMYETDVPRTDLVNIAYTLVHEISAAPKLPEGKKVVGKVYNFAIPIAKKFPAGDITISLTDDPPPLVNIALFMEAKNNWELLDTTVNGKKLTAKAPQSGIFSVLSDDK